MAEIPARLQETLDDFAFITDRYERTEYLIQIADRFSEVKVPTDIATPPYDESNRVPACESETFVWAVDQTDGTVKYYFDVLNPQGLSAMAMAVILDEGCSGAPLENIAAIKSDIVLEIFGRELSMGKGHGLIGIVHMVATEAKKRLSNGS